MRRSFVGLGVPLLLAMGLLFGFVRMSAATAVTSPDGLVTIYDIQFTADPSGDSPLAGQTVTTTGIVYAVYDEGYAVADAPGAWHGVYIYQPGGTKPQLGDELQVTGQVNEFFGFTEINNSSYTVLTSGVGPHPASPVQTGDIGTGGPLAENYEGVLVAVENVVVTDENPDDPSNFGEWEVSDGSGDVRVNDLADYDYTPTLSQTLYLVRGMLHYGFSNFKIEPRGDGDILLAPGLRIGKSAPATVAPGALMTYSIDVQNATGIGLTGVVVTDVVPANSTFAYALDGGSESGGVVEWTIPSLADLESAVVRFAVTATGTPPNPILNDDYAVRAANWMTTAVGDPVLTVIGDYAPAYLIQGDGFSSPYVGQTLTTRGVVVGFFEGNYPGGTFNGFFIQDETGDGDPTTSDALFVHTGSGNAAVSVGDLVDVTGEVQEFNEYDRDNCVGECWTVIATNDVGTDIQVIGAGSIAPLVLDPPGDPVASDAYFEGRESMLVTLPVTGAVVGPTNFGTIQVIPGDEGVDRALRGGPYEGMPFGVRHYERYGDIGGMDAPGLIVGSVVDNVDGPLAYSYGSFMVATQAGDAWTVVTAAPKPASEPTWPSAAADQFTIASFNTLNFDDASGAKMDKVVRGIVDLGCPSFLALEEIDVATVMTNLLSNLAAQSCPYDYANSHPDFGNHGVAVLWRTDQVSGVDWSTEFQACSPFGSSSSTAYDNFCDGIPGEYPLFSRRPVVVTGTVSSSLGAQEVVVIGNHFKSKLGGLPSDQRRLEQGQFVADLVDSFVAGGSDNVLVLGDLNDFEDAPPLEALYASGTLTSTWYTLPPNERYSYIFNGVSQVLDHILVSQAMADWLVDFGVLHVSADYPFNPYANDGGVVWHVSDHDMPAATFSYPGEPALDIAKDVTLPGGPVYPGDLVTYTVTLSNTGIATATAVHVTDTLPAGLIGADLDVMVTLAPGEVTTLVYTAVVADGALGQTITNTAVYDHHSGNGSASASFTVADSYSLFMPVIFRP